VGNNKILLIGGGVVVLFIIGLIIFFVSRGNGGGGIITNKGPKIINIWTTTDNKKALDPILNKFQDKNSNVKINYVVKNADTFLEDSINEIAAGNGPDLWVIPNDWLPQYSDKLVSMNETVLADSKKHLSGLEVYKQKFPQVISSGTIINNKIIGIPLTIDTLTLYYNPSLFSKVNTEIYQSQKVISEKEKSVLYGQINNWDDFVKAVQLITKKNGNKIERSAAAIGTADNISQSTDILTLLMMQNGAKMVSDDLKSAQFQTDQNQFSDIKFPGVKALEFYNSFSDPKSNNYTWNSEIEDSVRAFVEGKTAMIFDYPSVDKKIKLIDPKFEYSSITMPQLKETENIVNLAKFPVLTVTKASKNPDIAWDLILYLTTDSENLNTFQNVSGENIAYGSVKDSIKTAKTWYKPDPKKSDEIFKEMIRQANKGLDIPTAVQGAASQITTLLGKINQN